MLFRDRKFGVMNQSTTELGEQKALISKFQFGIMDTSKTLALTSREAYDNKALIFVFVLSYLIFG
jgi:hypothetical protein